MTAPTIDRNRAIALLRALARRADGCVGGLLEPQSQARLIATDRLGLLLQDIAKLLETERPPHFSNEDHVGIHAKRLQYQDASAQRERAFADQWRIDNTLEYTMSILEGLSWEFCEPTDSGSVDVSGVLYARGTFQRQPLGPMTARDARLAATLVQWLGTNVGMCFLESALESCGYRVEKVREAAEVSA